MNKFFDIHVAARLLAAKLVAGKGGDAQTLSFILVVQLVQLLVVVLGVATIGSNVDDNRRLAFVLVQRHLQKIC